MTNNMKNGTMEKTAETVVDKAAQIGEETKEKWVETTNEAKIQARRAAAQVGETAKSTVESRMGQVAGELSSVANVVRRTTNEVGRSTSPTLQNYGSRIADQLEGISSYVDENGVEEILADAQEFGRRRPVVFLGGAFMLGLVIGRFLRSTTPEHDTYGLDRYEPSRTPSPAYETSTTSAPSSYGRASASGDIPGFGRPPSQTDPTGTVRRSGTEPDRQTGTHADFGTGGTGSDNDRTNASVKTASKNPATRDTSTGSPQADKTTGKE